MAPGSKILTDRCPAEHEREKNSRKSQECDIGCPLRLKETVGREGSWANEYRHVNGSPLGERRQEDSRKKR